MNQTNEPRILSYGQMQYQMDAQVRGCPAHPDCHTLSPPSWLDPEDWHWKDKEMKKFTQDPARRAKLIEIQQEYIKGFPDHEGRVWCWMCTERRNLYDLGKDAEWCEIPRWTLILSAEKEWPPSWYPAIEDEGRKGKDVWLAVARHEHYIVIDHIYRHFTTGKGQDQVLAL